MTRTELEQLTECGHDLAAKVAMAIIAAANVGPCEMDMDVSMDTLNAITKTLGIDAVNSHQLPYATPIREVSLSFMEVDAVIYARVQR
jgi:hypothetical protein